ncbi:hypothetical protein [Vannielia sp. SX4]|uniref:hypothetical protein n=1 Tax=Vannielia sp. SX4 TaxID=3463852 RepID=UPI0040586FF7
MTISTSEWLAAGILVVGIGKAGWDFFLSEKLQKRDEEQVELGVDKLKEKVKSLRRSRKRDSRANQIAFAATTALSAWLIAIGFSTVDLDPKDVLTLKASVSSLEKQVSELEARLPKE